MKEFVLLEGVEVGGLALGRHVGRPGRRGRGVRALCRNEQRLDPKLAEGDRRGRERIALPSERGGGLR